MSDLEAENRRLQREIDLVSLRLGRLTSTPMSRRAPSSDRMPSWSDPRYQPRRYTDSRADELQSRLRESEAEAEYLRRQLSSQKEKRRSSLNLKVPAYNGSTDFDEYLSKFISICEYQEWSDEEAAILLLAKLEGDALSVAAALEDQTLRSIVSNLRRHFSQEQEELATLKLHGRTQKADETYESLTFDIKRLTKKAYAAADDNIRDRLAKDAFINAIADGDVRQKLRDKNPSTLADSLREAKRFAANQELERGRMEKGPSKSSKAEKSELQQLRQQVRRMNDGDDETVSSKKQTTPSFRNQMSGGSQWKVRNPREPPKCWRCYMKGHVMRWCPFTDEQIAEIRRAGKIPAEQRAAPEN